MWSLAFCITDAVEECFNRTSTGPKWRELAILPLILLLVSESTLYRHAGYDKDEARQRLAAIRQQIPAVLPSNPILYVHRPDDQIFWTVEIDAMLLAQENGWPH